MTKGQLVDKILSQGTKDTRLDVHVSTKDTSEITVVFWNSLLLYQNNTEYYNVPKSDKEAQEIVEKVKAFIEELESKKDEREAHLKEFYRLDDELKAMRNALRPKKETTK
jgi:peptidoglycan hydrolase CwlO-like protein